MRLVGHNVVTQLSMCLSAETVGPLCNAIFGESLNLVELMEEIREFVIGDLNLLYHWFNLSQMGLHNPEWVSNLAVCLRGNTNYCGLEVVCSRDGCDKGLTRQEWPSIHHYVPVITAVLLITREAS